MTKTLTKREYVTAGDATFTLESEKTSTRFTYRVRQQCRGAALVARAAPLRAGVHCAKTLHFVGVLTNPDNTRDYQFLGSIFDGERYAHGKKSKIGYDAPSAVAFRWFWSVVDHIEQIEGVRFYKSSYCCRCGRTLTVPESIRLGIGPECAQQVGLVPYGWEEEPRAHRGGKHDSAQPADLTPIIERKGESNAS